MHRHLTVTEAAETRRSIRRYTDEPVARETVEEILNVARLAPSPSNIQPWRVVAVFDHETRQRLMEAADNQKQVGQAPVVMVLYTDMDDVIATLEETVHPGMGDPAPHAAKLRQSLAGLSERELHLFGRGLGYIFMAYIVLAGTERGFGLSTMLGFDQDKVKSLLDLPKNAEIPVIISMGRPAQAGYSHHRHDLSKILRTI